MIVTITISDDLAARLRQRAVSERRAVEEVAVSLLHGALLADAWPTHAGAFPDDAPFQEMLAEIERQRRTVDQAAR